MVSDFSLVLTNGFNCGFISLETEGTKGRRDLETEDTKRLRDEETERYR